MWLHHFWNLLVGAWAIFWRTVGTTFVGALLALGVTAATFGASLYRVLKSQGWDAVKSLLRGGVRVDAITGLLIALVVYGSAAAWSVASAVYQDHQSTVRRALRDEADLRAKDDPLSSKIARLTLTVQSLRERNDALSEQDRENQVAIDRILLQPPALTVIPMYAAHGSARGKMPVTLGYRYLLLSSRTILSGTLVATCDRPINSDFLATAMTGHGGFNFDDSKQVSARSVEEKFWSPAWTPTSPYFMEVHWDDPSPTAPDCQVQVR